MPRTRLRPTGQKATIALVVVLSAAAGVLVPVAVELTLPHLTARTPEEAARAAVRAVQQRDYSGYAAIVLNHPDAPDPADALRAGTHPSAGAGDALDAALDPGDQARLRAEFESLAGSGYLDAAAGEGVVTRTVAQTDGTWLVELSSAGGVPLGISVVVTEFEGAYRVTALRTEPPPFR